MNVEVETYTDCKAELVYQVEGNNYSAYYSKEIRIWDNLGKVKKETIGLWKGDNSEGFVIFKSTKDDFDNEEYDVFTKNVDDDKDSIKKFALNWLEDVMKDEVLTSRERSSSLSLAEIFGIVKIILF